MRVLIIEDSARKLTNLVEFVKEISKDAEIIQKRSYSNGLESALDGCFDLILLDMSLPFHDITADNPSSDTLVYAGRDILKELQRLKKDCNVVVVTQFPEFGEGAEKITLDELTEELGNSFTKNYLGTIYYLPSKLDWQLEIANIIDRLGFGIEND